MKIIVTVLVLLSFFFFVRFNGQVLQLPEQKILIRFDSVMVTPQVHKADSSLSPLIGFLHSYPDTSLWRQFVFPLRPNFWRNKSYFEEYHRLAKSYNPDFHYQMSLAGSYPAINKGIENEFWPFTNYAKWEEYRLDKLSLLPANSQNQSVDIWNEPNLPSGKYWKGTPHEFYEMFCETINFLNENHPELPTAGPSATGSTAREFTKGLLSYMAIWKSNNPNDSLRLDWIAIHGLGQNQKAFLSDLQYWSKEVYENKNYAKIGVTDLIYNEYIRRGEESKYFAWALRYLEAFEKYGVKYAGRTCWGTCNDGTLDGLLSIDSSGRYFPNENWFGYASYAKLTGKRYVVQKTNRLSIIAGEVKENQTKLILLSNTENFNVDCLMSARGLETNKLNYFYEISDKGLIAIDRLPNWEEGFIVKAKTSYLISELPITL